VLDELTLTDGHRLGYAQARRNIITHGIDLNTLVGQCFKVGDVLASTSESAINAVSATLFEGSTDLRLG
jgi:hypothetical protein